MHSEMVLKKQMDDPLGNEISSLSNQAISHFWIFIGRMRV